MRVLISICFVLITTTVFSALSTTDEQADVSPSGNSIEAQAQQLNPETDGLAEEAEAMGGEEFPLIPVGKLHGDWLFVAVDLSFEPLFATQIIQEKGASSANGDIAIRAKGWNLGRTTGHESFEVKLNGDNMDYVANLSNQTLSGELKWDGQFWRGWMQFDKQNKDLMSVALIRPYDLDAGIEIFFPPLLEAHFMVVDERGQLITSPTQWDVIQGDAQDGTVVETNNGEYSPGAIQADHYVISATSGNLHGHTRIKHISNGPNASQNYYLTLKPKDEGSELPIEVAFFCSEGENCHMQVKDIPLLFTLPKGWGAEMPLKLDAETIMFNMVKITTGGPFYVTLNQPQRMAELGPCLAIALGSLCHDYSYDETLLKEFQIIAESLTVKSK